MRKILTAALLISLAACASSGVRINDNQLSKMHKGKTTYAEAIKEYGSPTQSYITADGGRTISYMYVSSQVRPESFIPIVGAFAGGADSQSSIVSLYFDKEGILTNYTSSTSGMGTGTGVEAYSQPRHKVSDGND